MLQRQKPHESVCYKNGQNWDNKIVHHIKKDRNWFAKCEGRDRGLSSVAGQHYRKVTSHALCLVVHVEMWAKLFILRAHSTFVKQWWEMEWLNRAQGWQSINLEGHNRKERLWENPTLWGQAAPCTRLGRWLVWKLCRMQPGKWPAYNVPPCWEPL